MDNETKQLLNAILKEVGTLKKEISETRKESSDHYNQLLGMIAEQDTVLESISRDVSYLAR